MNDPILDGVLGNAIWAFFSRGIIFGASSSLRRLKKPSAFKATTICLKHRNNTRERYYEGAFRSGKDVLYLSVMSQSTLKDMPSHLEECGKYGTTLRVLTWDQTVPKALIEAYRLHLNEPYPERAIEQARNAAKDWRELENQFKYLDVREYRSLPTMQGLIVKDSWALIELIPFNTHTHDRPALLLTPGADPELFELFRQKWEDLWMASH